MNEVQVLLLKVLIFVTMYHAAREEERSADGQSRGGGKKVKKMKKERSFSGGVGGGGAEGGQQQQQVYEISPSVSRRGIGGGKAHSSSTRLRDTNNHRDGAMSSRQPIGYSFN